jgi:hypothetical protein
LHPKIRHQMDVSAFNIIPMDFGCTLGTIKVKRFQVSVFRIVCLIPLTFVDLTLPLALRPTTPAPSSYAAP